MALRANVAIDCADPHALARFWAAALGWVLEDHDGNLRRLVDAGRVPGDIVTEIDGRLELRDWAAIRHPDDPVHPRSGVGQGRRVLFQRVPEPKTGKNRLHLDIHVDGGDVAAEVERLVGLGAIVREQLDEPIGQWTVLADPAGNEFCVAL